MLDRPHISLATTSPDNCAAIMHYQSILLAILATATAVLAVLAVPAVPAPIDNAQLRDTVEARQCYFIGGTVICDDTESKL